MSRPHIEVATWVVFGWAERRSRHGIDVATWPVALGVATSRPGLFTLVSRPGHCSGHCLDTVHGHCSWTLFMRTVHKGSKKKKSTKFLKIFLCMI